MQPSPVPSPCPGVGAPLVVPLVDPAVISSAVERGTVLVGQMFSKFLAAVKDAADQGVQTVSQLLGKFDGVVGAGQAAGQSTIDGLAATFRQSALSQAALPTTGGVPGGGAAGGIQPDDFAYNVWQRDQAPWEAEVLPRGMRPVLAQHPYCFMGSYDNVYDAVDQARAIDGTPTPVQCHPPGGGGPIGFGIKPPGGNGSPPGTGPCTGKWDVWIYPSPGGGKQCIVFPCENRPAGQTPDKTFDTEAEARAWADSNCGGGPPPPPPADKYYGGCDKNGKPVTWKQGEAEPAGVTSKNGPFDSQDLATSWANVTCKSSTGGNGGGPPTGTCCPVTLPDCIHIDLCDWQKFKETLVEALCEWYKLCVCKLENETAYMTADCDPELRSQLQGWLGSTGGAVANAGSMDEVVSKGQGMFQGDATVGGGNLRI